MRPMNSPLAAAGFLLVLTTGAFAAPILSESSVGGHGGYWTPNAYGPWTPGSAFHPWHRPHGLDLRAGHLAKDHGSHGAANLPFGLGRLDEGYPIPSRLCGGAPGAGLSQYPSEGPSEAPDLEDGQPGEDGSDTRISATGDLDRKANPIPAVPEPGSLALLGAGALGLLAARGLLKDH
jgi:hypothetical protein